ncbi:ankyrin and het domain-containing protein [Colletotrichum plurivorum]|uniref:Ankyrin and het domain-containing protein n=1 Tax=Colletotrichum plurivorum TaxID=2175906 RepID=A0A8H6K743_9PEZI|nr:ankyrin and het domain-containing protein [Colletotrichum plurivorum]
MSHLEEYRYTWLPTGKYTRLIRLLPTKRFEDPVKILLDVVSLEPPPKYEALSYAWENQTPDQPIDCGGQRLLVTQTCFGALRRLRRKKKPRTLWIDGICIDQHSTAEKNHQVALMGPIYSSAERVVIWLGEDRKGVDSMLNLLRYNLTGIVDHHGLYRSFSTLNTDEDRIRAVLSAAECAWLWIKAGDSLSQAPSGQVAHLMFRDASEDTKLRPIQLGLLELIRSTDESTFDLARFQKYQEAQSEAGRKEKTTLVESTPRGIEVKLKALLSWNKEPKPRYPESGPENSFWDYFLCFWNSCNGSALFWTENNAMGIALPARRVGDVLALIPGLEWPMLLRRSANGNFKVVSPAFIRRDQGWYMFRREKLQHIVLE